jgi:putative Mg2+ transporter-C (MgtC) family protein
MAGAPKRRPSFHRAGATKSLNGRARPGANHSLSEPWLLSSWGSPVMTMQLAQAGLNLLIAACLGAAIGLERQWRQRLAGLRTNTLVTLGAAIFVTYSHVVPDGGGDTRIAAQVVSGIGFLGAGVIFKEGLNVRGLNTAATLWCSAAVGLLAGEGLALYGLVAAALVLGANTALRPIVHAINRQPIDSTEEEQNYLVSIDCRAARACDIRPMLIQEFAAVPDVHFLAKWTARLWKIPAASRSRRLSPRTSDGGWRWRRSSPASVRPTASFGRAGESSRRIPPNRRPARIGKKAFRVSHFAFPTPSANDGTPNRLSSGFLSG